MCLNRRLIVSILILFVSFTTWASHIVGGDLEMQHFSGDRFEVTLQLYYDGVNGQDFVEPSIVVSSFRKSDNFKIEDFVLTRLGDYTIPVLTNTQCDDGYNIRIYTYKARIFLDENIYSSSDGYYLSWQRCCRSNIISNVPQSGSEGFVFYLEFPNGIDHPTNSSPKFTPIKGDYFCVGKPVSIDMSAIDFDSDSLVYSIVDPLAGFTTETNNVIQGGPGPYPLVRNYSSIPTVNGLSISPRGQISFTPSSLGLYLLAVLCEEYKNGQKIGEVRREILILVRDCGSNTEPSITLFPFGENKPYIPGDTILIRNLDDLCHTVRITDGDPNEFVELEITPLNYQSDGPIANPTATVLIESSDVFESQLCIDDCFDLPQNYFEFILTAKDDYCPESAEASINVKMRVLASENRPPSITTDYIPGTFDIGEEIRFKVIAFDPDSGDMPQITMASKTFDPASIGMQFETRNNGNTTTGEYYWQPLCDNLLNINLYELRFTSGDNNCGIQLEDSVDADITVEFEEVGLFDKKRAPNVITPNGDGYNDFFTLPVLGGNECQDEEFGTIEIYNRWGRKVYESTDENFQWRAEGVPAGDYFYRIHFQESTFKGYLHLLL